MDIGKGSNEDESGVLGLFAMAAASICAQSAPQPDKDGIYTAGRGLTPAKLVHAVAAVYPTDPVLAGVKHICALRVVVGADGVPGAIQILNEKPSPFDEAAIAAVKQSQFEAAIFQEKRVATRITLLVPFNVGKEPGIPIQGGAGQKGVSPPTALESVADENGELARKGALPGVVFVSMLVTEKGLPTDIHLIRPIGNGHDEDVLNAAQKYRFRPATLYGLPVPFAITVEVSSYGY